MSQDPAPRLVVCLSGRAAPAAPFWELETLILQGFERELALDILAARRSGAAQRTRVGAGRGFAHIPGPVFATALRDLAVAGAESY
ncbi:hypothetical protein [Bosea sp. (in: a-proteobacteria)]|uniref:hypothetical protein n=1 Tax=Bosea sp. (in: a-proteobacteria) TaxID=1871050 RepID=UPI0027356D49|nr:hypothetical protein [Bosea sp. (in: a-proteobacteria)]MDP3256267.1 hypothetical protein [Bosea sp. (in: a-proteobacteria)]